MAVMAFAVATILAGCAEKNEYQNAVLEQMKVDKDIKDYGLSPETMTSCVVGKSSDNMPGVVFLDPSRREAYRNYAKMLGLSGSKDPQKTLEELRKTFGSPKSLADAHSNYVESVMECMSDLVTNTEIASNKAK